MKTLELWLDPYFLRFWTTKSAKMDKKFAFWHFVYFEPLKIQILRKNNYALTLKLLDERSLKPNVLSLSNRLEFKL
jgi:hypothetical protein